MLSQDVVQVRGAGWKFYANGWVMLVRLQIERVFGLARGKQSCGLEASHDAFGIVEVELHVLARKRRKASEGLMQDTVFLAFLWRIEVGVILEQAVTSVQDDSLLEDQRKPHWQHLDELR